MIDRHITLQRRSKRSHVAGTVHVSLVWRQLTDGKDIDTLFKEMVNNFKITLLIIINNNNLFIMKCSTDESSQEAQFKARSILAKTKNKGTLGELLSFGIGKGKIIGKVNVRGIDTE